jgi:hypothetical protein
MSMAHCIRSFVLGQEEYNKSTPSDCAHMPNSFHRELSKFNCALTPKVRHMFKLQFLKPRSCQLRAFVRITAHSLLALSMEIDTLDAARDLVKADIVETFETRTADRSHAVIWHKEVLFPAHKKMLFLLPILRDQLQS